MVLQTMDLLALKQLAERDPELAKVYLLKSANSAVNIPAATTPPAKKPNASAKSSTNTSQNSNTNTGKNTSTNTGVKISGNADKAGVAGFISPYYALREGPFDTNKAQSPTVTSPAKPANGAFQNTGASGFAPPPTLSDNTTEWEYESKQLQPSYTSAVEKAIAGLTQAVKQNQQKNAGHGAEAAILPDLPNLSKTAQGLTAGTARVNSELPSVPNITERPPGAWEYIPLPKITERPPGAWEYIPLPTITERPPGAWEYIPLPKITERPPNAKEYPPLPTITERPGESAVKGGAKDVGRVINPLKKAVSTEEYTGGAGEKGIILYDPAEVLAKSAKLKEKFQSGGLWDKALAILQMVGVSWEARYKAARAGYIQGMAAYGVNPEMASDTFDMTLLEIIGSTVRPVVKGIRGSKTAAEGAGENFKTGSFDDLPSNAQNSYKGYEGNGWKGNYSGQTPGTNAGSLYRNKNNLLPKSDSFGNTITYKEFDVNNRITGTGRDAERFIVGSDGSLYYTVDHYTTFTKIK